MKLDHIAIDVKEPDWYIRFFEECFSETVVKTEGTKTWLKDGIQINKVETEYICSGHVAFVVDDYEDCLKRVYEYENVHPSDGGYNWPCLPNGLVIEVLKPGGGIRF